MGRRPEKEDAHLAIAAAIGRFILGSAFGGVVYALVLLRAVPMVEWPYSGRVFLAWCALCGLVGALWPDLKRGLRWLGGWFRRP